jgi:hypothetical protein
MAAKKKSKPRPYWERAYKGHAYWQGTKKLGKVTLLAGRPTHPDGKYRWEAAGKAGFAEHLAKAKAAVELAVSSADKQLDLFT